MSSARRDSNSLVSLLGGPEAKKPFLIGVSGGTASGKTSVCEKIIDKLGQNSVEQQRRQVVIISQESFYKELNEQETQLANEGKYNFDHPNALDDELMLKMLKDIKAGKVVEIPVYDFLTNARKRDQTTTIYQADVYLIEGILLFYFPQIREMFNMCIFVDTDPDTRLARRVLRDTECRRRDLEQILSQYIKFVKPAFEEFCLPTKKYADIIIPRGADNEVAVNLIVKSIEELLQEDSESVKDGERRRYKSESQVIRTTTTRPLP